MRATGASTTDAARATETSAGGSGSSSGATAVAMVSIEAIDAILPQTQCTKCGYPSCRRYAEAIAAGAANVNQCPPGGDAGIRALARATGRPYLPLNPANGVERPRQVALVDEARCIGCTLCIQACPVDAIVGAAKQMHTVVTELCSGCDLCIAPCPVDCIDMVSSIDADALWDRPRADAARTRFERRTARLAQERAERAERLARQTATARAAPDADVKRAAIQAAIERARARRAAVVPRNTESLSPEALEQIAAIEARRAGRSEDPS